jgi:hypothetical protein
MYNMGVRGASGDLRKLEIDAVHDRTPDPAAVYLIQS